MEAPIFCTFLFLRREETRIQVGLPSYPEAAFQYEKGREDVFYPSIHFRTLQSISQIYRDNIPSIGLLLLNENEIY